MGQVADSSPVAELSNAHGMMGIGSGHSHDPLRYAHLFLLGTVEESGQVVQKQPVDTSLNELRFPVCFLAYPNTSITVNCPNFSFTICTIPCFLPQD